MPLARETLIQDVWPDKALFANVLLLVAGSLGVIHGFVVAVDGIAFTSAWLSWIENYPAWTSVVLSLAAAAFSIASLRLRSVALGFASAMCAFFSFGLVLVEPLLALLAAYFLGRARSEGEDPKPATLRLTSRQWPDKSLAASALLLMVGTSTINWWSGLLVGFIHVEGLSGLHPAWSVVGVLVGLVAVLRQPATLLPARSPPGEPGRCGRPGGDGPLRRGAAPLRGRPRPHLPSLA